MAGYIWKYLDTFGYVCDVWMHLDIVGYVWICLRCVWIWLDIFESGGLNNWTYLNICLNVFGLLWDNWINCLDLLDIFGVGGWPQAVWPPVRIGDCRWPCAGK